MRSPLALLALAACSPHVVTPPAAAPADDRAADVVYGVVPFFFEGQDFDGVTARLDHLAALGVDVLWISPVAACAEDDFGYAVVDHRALREQFGDEADLRELVDGAHARGLEVVLDLALNHSSDQHPWFTDPTTAHHYDRDEAGEPTHYFDWEHLPNLNYDEPVVREAMLDAVAWWIDEFGVDGYRFDAAWGVRRRAQDFWPEVRARVGPEPLLVAEASARDGGWAAQGMDAAYDWTDELGEWAWRDAFEDPAHTGALLRDAIEAELDVRVLRFLDNNDTGERFATRYGADVTRVAAALLMTLPGLPVVYTGTEVGAALDVYQEGPPLDWADPDGLVATWTEWIALREDHPALTHPALAFVDTAPDALGYWRGVGDDRLLVGLAFGEAGGALPAQDVDLVDVRDGSIHRAGRPIQLGPHGVRLLRATDPSAPPRE